MPSLFVGPTGQYVNTKGPSGSEDTELGKVTALTKKEYETKYGKIEEVEEVEEVIMNENQIRSLVRKSLMKHLEKSVSIKGYIQSVGKDVGVDTTDTNTMALVKDEVEQSITDMVGSFRKRFSKL